MWITFEFLFKNIILPASFESKHVHLTVIWLPISENNLSLGTEEPEIDKYFLTNLVTLENWVFQTAYYSKGFTLSSAIGVQIGSK